MMVDSRWPAVGRRSRCNRGAYQTLSLSYFILHTSYFPLPSLPLRHKRPVGLEERGSYGATFIHREAYAVALHILQLELVRLVGHQHVGGLSGDGQRERVAVADGER